MINPNQASSSLFVSEFWVHPKEDQTNKVRRKVQSIHKVEFARTDQFIPSFLQLASNDCHLWNHSAACNQWKNAVSSAYVDHSKRFVVGCNGVLWGISCLGYAIWDPLCDSVKVFALSSDWNQAESLSLAQQKWCSVNIDSDSEASEDESVFDDEESDCELEGDPELTFLEPTEADKRFIDGCDGYFEGEKDKLKKMIAFERGETSADYTDDEDSDDGDYVAALAKLSRRVKVENDCNEDSYEDGASSEEDDDDADHELVKKELRELLRQNRFWDGPAEEDGSIPRKRKRITKFSCLKEEYLGDAQTSRSEVEQPSLLQRVSGCNERGKQTIAYQVLTKLIVPGSKGFCRCTLKAFWTSIRSRNFPIRTFWGRRGALGDRYELYDGFVSGREVIEAMRARAKSR